MDIPTFSQGEPPSAEKLNAFSEALHKLNEECQSARITDFSGGTFTRGAFGTTLAVAPMPRRSDCEGSEGGTAASPFQVTANVGENGKIRLSVSGGNWRGRGAGNYIGIPYEDLKTGGAFASATLNDAEDLFPIPDCELEESISDGETFAVVLYSPGAEKGVLKTYPWLYYVKIEDLKTFRNKLKKYAYSTVAVVGVWKCEKNNETDTLSLTGVPGQMLTSDFWYYNDQVFSRGE